MEYVTMELFFWVVGALVAIVSALIGYWIKEIKGIGKSLDKHEKEDETEFYKAQRYNDSEHARIEALLHEKTGIIENAFAKMETKLDFIVENIKKISEK
jgi:hypothetical protein